MKILFLNRSLNYGGTERQLLLLARGLKSSGHDVTVANFYDEGPLRKDLQAAGIHVLPLHKRGRWDVVGFLRRLIGLLRRERPDVLYSLLGIPNLFAAATMLFVRGPRIVWSVRASTMDLSQYDWLIRLAYGLECRLARLADLIIVNSRAGMDHAVRQGFPARNMVLIANGVNTDVFAPDRQAGKALRAQWGVGDDHALIGLVARLDPMKDHRNFLHAAALFVKDDPSGRFVCVGDGLDSYRRELRELSERLGIADVVIWEGLGRDMPAIYNAFDVACLSSLTEGFPNAILEAMACGVPCVATDVGDSALIIGDTGMLVPPHDPAALCLAWKAMVRLGTDGRQALGARAHERIAGAYSITEMTKHTAEALEAIVSRPNGRQPLD